MVIGMRCVIHGASITVGTTVGTMAGILGDTVLGLVITMVGTDGIDGEILTDGITVGTMDGAEDSVLRLFMILGMDTIRSMDQDGEVVLGMEEIDGTTVGTTDMVGITGLERQIITLPIIIVVE